MNRRNFFIRSVTAVAGDAAIGFAMASACIWVIQSAALGVFVSFLLWLLTIIVSLTLSQHVLHPAVALLLSDRKLDRGLTVSLKSMRAIAIAGATLWDYVQAHASDLRSGPSAA